MNKNNITLKSVVAAISLVACAGLISPQVAVGSPTAHREAETAKAHRG